MRSLNFAALFSICVFSLAASANPAGVAPTTFGVDAGIINGSTAYSSVDLNTLMAKFKAQGLKHVRVDVNLAADTDSTIVTNFQAALTAATAQGIELKPIIQVPFAWGDRTDNGQYPAGNAAALYSQGYNRTYNFVRQFATKVRDWEMGNELNLLVKDASGSPLFGRGTTAAEFDVSIMHDWAYVLRGISDAIDTINAEQSVSLRRVLGTTSSMFGFIDYMRSHCVKVDVVGYHYYEHAGVDPYHYWLAAGGTFDLFAKMASYNVPIFVNEMNCAEIYDSNFVNTGTSTTMQTCSSNFATMLHTFANQTEAPIEIIQAYEFFDEPTKSGAEARFGMMFDINTPKPLLAALSTEAFADLVCTGSTVTVTSPMALPAGSCFSSRASNGVYTDTNGVINTAAANVARLDFNAGTHAFNGVWLEPAATNLVPNSTNISSTSYYVRNGSPIFNQTTTAPDNSLAYSIASSVAYSGVYKGVPTTPNTPYTYSVYIKYVSGANTVRVGLAAGFVDFNTQTGAISLTYGLTGTPSVTPVGNGWYRVVLTVTSDASSNHMNLTAYNRAASAQETAVWGVQVELGTVATSYIATTTAAVTRAADVYRNP